eukprot:Em0008g91a
MMAEGPRKRVKCLRVIKRRDLSNERNTFKSKTIFYHKKTRLNPRARYKTDPEKKKASVRDSYKADPEKKKASVRDSYKADPEKKKASVRDSYKADPERKKASVRDSYKAVPKRRRPLYATATTQILNLSNLLKGNDIKRTSRRTALLKGRNTRTIQLPLRHLKSVLE